MSQAFESLRRFDGTSTYEDLQRVFVQLTEEAEAGRENPGLAAKLDEVIEQLVRERARDERELRDLQSRYEAFREQNRGVVGWFKRHLPFTETRREETRHQGDIANESAEILADNLVIARAQMLKEKVLPPATRRLGNRVRDWQGEWERHRTEPASAAKVLARLHGELGPSRTFLAELQKDIEAFSTAEFKEEADLQRRNADLQIARQEWEELNQEMTSEQALKESSLKALVNHLAIELESTDAQFRQDGQQLEQLDLFAARLNDSRTSVTRLVATAAQASAIARQLQALPEQMQQARQAISRWEGERTAAVQAASAKSQILHERQLRETESQRGLDQAKQVLASLKPSYDTYLAQRAAAAAMPQAAEAEPLPPIASQFQTAQGAVEQAQRQVQVASAAAAEARRDAESAQANAKAIDEKIASEQTKLKELESKEPQCRADLLSHTDRGLREFAAAASAFAAYLQLDGSRLGTPAYHPEQIAAGTFGYLGSRGMEAGLGQGVFQSSTNLARQAQAMATLERIVQWQESQHHFIEEQRAQSRSRRSNIWKRRCSELLGNELAEEACRDGLLAISPKQL